MVAFKSGTAGCHVGIYYGHTRVTGEVLNATGDDHVFTFDHAPVSMQNLIITGTLGGVTRVLVNYELEPLVGTLTVGAALPAFTTVTASYYYYSGNSGDDYALLVKDFDVPYNEHNYELSIFGEPVYTLNHNYPAKVTFKAVLSNEAQRNLLTEAMERGYFFILVDKYVDATYGQRAYEGPIVASEIASFFKGKSYLLPIILEVQQRGTWDEVADTIDWTAFL